MRNRDFVSAVIVWLFLSITFGDAIGYAFVALCGCIVLNKAWTKYKEGKAQ